jgi:hypothetical protein
MELENEKGRVVVWPKKTSGAGTESNFEHDFIRKEGSLPVVSEVAGGCPGRHRSNHRVLAVDSSYPPPPAFFRFPPNTFLLMNQML